MTIYVSRIMTKTNNNVTLEYNIPVPKDLRSGKAQEIAKSMEPGASCLIATRNQALAIANALKRLGGHAVIRQQKDRVTRKVHGYRVWRDL